MKYLALPLALLLALMPFDVLDSAHWEVVETVVPEPAEEVKPTTLGLHTITAYCPCEICCGEWAKNRPNGIVYGAHGIELEEGVSCASPLPKGTVIIIEGLGEYTVHDTTADWIVDRYDGKIIDIYFESHEDALRFGKKQLEVFLVEEP